MSSYMQLITLILFVGLASCTASSSNAPGAPEPPIVKLSASQKESFKRLLNEIFRVQKIPQSYLDGKNGGSNFDVLSRLPAGLQNNLTPSNQDIDLRKKLDQEDCVIDLPINENTGELELGDGFEGKIPKFKVEMSGDRCPIYALMQLSGEQLPSGLKAQFLFKYQVFSDDFRKDSDVDDIDLIGTLHAETIVEGQSNFAFKAAFGFVGRGHSQTQGEFKLKNGLDVQMKLSAQPAQLGQALNSATIPGFFLSNTMIHALTTSAYHAVLKAETKADNPMNANVMYTLNNDVLSEGEYKEYLKNETPLPGMGSEEEKSKQPEDQLQCQLTFYSADEVSRDQLQKIIDENGTVKNLPRGYADSCWGDSQDFGIDGILFNLNFSRNQDYTTVMLTSVDKNLRDEFFVVADQISDLALSVSSYSLRLTCLPRRPCGQNGLVK